MSESRSAHESCSDDPCAASGGRRAFLKEGLMAVAALTALGATADRLEAMGRTYATGTPDGDLLRYPIPTADGATIDAANDVVVVRYQGSLHAFDVECPHRGTDVEWQGDRGRFYCPKHKSTFQPEGTLIGGKAERGMDRYPVRREGNELVVDTATTIRSTDADAWAAARVPA